jgi:hypothetical protein
VSAARNRILTSLTAKLSRDKAKAGARPFAPGRSPTARADIRGLRFKAAEMTDFRGKKSWHLTHGAFEALGV